jgi:hypothetical protein
LEPHYNMSSGSAVESYLNSRHERSMIRLCALLWVLKIQEEQCTNRQMASRSEPARQNESRSSVLASVVNTNKTTACDRKVRRNDINQIKLNLLISSFCRLVNGALWSFFLKVLLI